MKDEEFMFRFGVEDSEIFRFYLLAKIFFLKV